MSKYMQITVTVRPYYPRGIQSVYPKLARHLGTQNPALVESQPSPYDLAGQWDQLLYACDGTELGEALRRHRQPVNRLRAAIEADIADRKLASADRRLYELEDIFDDLEAELR